MQSKNVGYGSNVSNTSANPKEKSYILTLITNINAAQYDTSNLQEALRNKLQIITQSAPKNTKEAAEKRAEPTELGLRLGEILAKVEYHNSFLSDLLDDIVL